MDWFKSVMQCFFDVSAYLNYRALVMAASESTVYLAINLKSDPTIVQARSYQKSAYYTFMSNPNITRIDFHYPNDIKFKIVKFTSANNPSFCKLENETNDEYILSDNFYDLQQYIGYMKRLTSGGAKKKRTMKKRAMKKSVY
jgi:hypothetical protein